MENLTIPQLFTEARSIAERGLTIDGFVHHMTGKYPGLADDAILRAKDKTREDATFDFWKGQYTRLRNTLTAELKEAREKKNEGGIKRHSLGITLTALARKKSSGRAAGARAAQIDALNDVLDAELTAIDTAKADKEKAALEVARLKAEADAKLKSELEEAAK